MPSQPASRLGYTLVGVFAFLIVVALFVSGVSLLRAKGADAASASSQQSWIAVCGHGKTKATPDQARLSLGVFATAPTVHDARDQAAQAMALVLASLKGNGVADQDIQTEYVAIQPQYYYSSNAPTLTGYNASNTVTVTIHTLANVGTIIDGAAEKGGNHVAINGITFSAGDPAQARIDAQKDAVADAERQAQQVAASAGAKLGPALSIDVGACSGGPPTAPSNVDRATQVHQATTQIEPGQLDVSIDVTVVYALR